MDIDSKMLHGVSKRGSKTGQKLLNCDIFRFMKILLMLLLNPNFRYIYIFVIYSASERGHVFQMFKWNGAYIQEIEHS